jgi:hypothetical protein
VIMIAPFYNIKGEILNNSQLKEQRIIMPFIETLWNYILSIIKIILKFIVQLLILLIWWVAVFVFIIIFPVSKTVHFILWNYTPLDLYNAQRGVNIE